MKKDQKGFTLIEMLMVVAIMGLIVGVAIRPIFKSLEKIKTKTEVKKMAATLRYARSQAVARKDIYQVNIDIDNNSYWLIEHRARTTDEQENTDEQVNEDDEEATERRHFNKIFKLPPEIKINGFRLDEEKEITGGSVPVSFYPLGNCSGGELILGKEDKNIYKIILDPIVGRARIEDADE